MSIKKILFSVIIAGALTACSKDKFKTVPQVKIESFGPEEVRVGDEIQLRATVTDKEGDLQDSVIVVRKRYSGSDVLTTDSIRVSLRGLSSPVKDKIELFITFLYGRLDPGRVITQDLEYNFDRDFAVGLVVLDNQGNRSEYVESNRIVLKKF
jgi:hypothetical protein